MDSASEEDRYSTPLPWIGLYVAGASLVCAVLMTMDLVHSLRRRKLWIAPKFFSLNAATLTLLAVATKLPSDITTVMFGYELLTKLSGVVLISVTISHFMPCLSLMDGVGVLSSVVALGILVLTTFVNIFIQISTGILGSWKFIFAVFSSVMLSKFVIFVSYSLTVTTTKNVLKQEYSIKHEKIVKETTTYGKLDEFSPRKMEEILKKYWLMALTSSPDFTVLRSGMCPVSGILDYITVILPYSYLMALVPGYKRSITPGSDYKWSPSVILPMQVAAISVGIVGSLLRVAKSQPTSDFSSWNALFKIDSHWVFQLHEWREAPLPFCKSPARRRLRMVILGTKSLAVDLLMVLQIGVILVSKFFLFLMRCIWWITLGWVWMILTKFVLPLCCTIVNKVGNEEGSLDLGCLAEYALHLEEENTNNGIHAMEVVKRWHKYPIRWIKSARTDQPHKLLHLLRHNCIPSRDFEELGRPYDTLLVQLTASNSEGQQPSRCWSLPITTLAAIARTLAAPEQKNAVRNLMDIVGEGLQYVRFVEENLGTSEAQKKQEAADVVWEGIDVYGRWLGVDLDKMIPLDWSTTINKLDSIAEGQLQLGKSGKKLKRPSGLLAAACMRDVVGVMLSNPDRTEREGSGPGSLEQLQRVVAYALGACLINLPLAIFAQCSSGNFGEREEAVKDAAIMLGQTEEILKWLSENESLMNFYSAHREKMRLPSVSDEYVSSHHEV